MIEIKTSLYNSLDHTQAIIPYPKAKVSCISSIFFFLTRYKKISPPPDLWLTPLRNYRQLLHFPQKLQNFNILLLTLTIGIKQFVKVATQKTLSDSGVFFSHSTRLVGSLFWPVTRADIKELLGFFPQKSRGVMCTPIKETTPALVYYTMFGKSMDTH